MNSTDEMLSLVKLLSNLIRLKIIGLLALQPRSLEQLATALSLSPKELVHHLDALTDGGLVAVNGQRVYSLEEKSLEQRAQRLLAQSRPSAAESEDLDAFDRKVLSDFMGRDGRLRSLPTQHKKLLSVLRYCSKLFEPGVRYTERDVNQTLARVHDDTAALRRALVDHRFMARSSGIYWRTDDAMPPPDATTG